MSETEDTALSLVRGDPALRAQRAIGLLPADGLGVLRRAVVLALVSWLPIAVWASLGGRALAGAVDEPLLHHFGIQVRCLVAIPLFVIGEAVSHGITTRLFPQFLNAGLVREGDTERFREVLRGVARLRDRTLPWLLLIGLVLVATVLSPGPAGTHEVLWDGEPTGGYGFGAGWFLWVVRPLFLALLLGWLWRLVLACVLCRRLARLDLALSPTHPDGAAGLGFLELLPMAFSPVVLAISAVLAAHWAHEVAYHGTHVASLRMPMITFAVAATLIFLAPLFFWQPPLAAAKRRAELEYGALVARHGRLVQRRWIEREPVVDDAILSAPELGPVADTAALYTATRKLKVVPLGKRSLAALLLPAALPQLAVVAIELPLKDVLLGLLKTLA